MRQVEVWPDSKQGPQVMVDVPDGTTDLIAFLRTEFKQRQWHGSTWAMLTWMIFADNEETITFDEVNTAWNAGKQIRLRRYAH